MPKMDTPEIKAKYLPDWHFVGCYSAEHDREQLYADIYTKSVSAGEMYAIVLNGYAAKKVDPSLGDKIGDGFFWIVFTDGVRASGLCSRDAGVGIDYCMDNIIGGYAQTWDRYISGGTVTYKTFVYEIYKKAFGVPKGMEGQAQAQEIAQAEPEGQKKCTCPIDQLMYSGCGCGGA